MTRDLTEESKYADLIVVGAGLAGVGAAVAAARRGLAVILVGDRPFVGGNASKEHCVHVSGAEGSVLNHCYRETGLLEELRLENLWRNPDGNAEDWQITLNDFVIKQENLTLAMNTSICAVEADDGRIKSVTGIQLATEKRITFAAPLFVDCTGDGTVGYLAGCDFAVGRESKDAFGERFAPETDDPETMGASIMMFFRDAGHPIPFVRPDWVPQLDKSHFAERRVPEKLEGLFTWWIEFGGRLDSITDNEEIHRELLKISYGVWDFIKNHPSRAEANVNTQLAWSGYLPAKRESRRIAGLHWFTGEEVLDQSDFADAIGFGGWTMDDHPSGGFYDTKLKPSVHVTVPGLYNFPLRCLVAKDVENLMLAGRCASVTHQALATTRVMATCMQMGEACGAAAAWCERNGDTPHELIETDGAVAAVQRDLLKSDHYIAGLTAGDADDLAPAATVSASSVATAELLEGETVLTLEADRMIMLPVTGELKTVSVLLDVATDTQLAFEWWRADEKGNAFPARRTIARSIELSAGRRQWISFPVQVDPGFVGACFLVLFENPDIGWHATRRRRAGFRNFAAYQADGVRHINPISPWAICEHGDWEKWTCCVRTDPTQSVYGPANVTNGIARAAATANLWLSDETDFGKPEWIELAWDAPEQIETVQLAWDSDLERDLRTVGRRMPARVIETLPRDYNILVRKPGGKDVVIEEVRDNHQRFRIHELTPSRVTAVRIEILRTWGAPRVGLYEIRVR